MSDLSPLDAAFSLAALLASFLAIVSAALLVAVTPAGEKRRLVLLVAAVEGACVLGAFGLAVSSANDFVARFGATEMRSLLLAPAARAIAVLGVALTVANLAFARFVRADIDVRRSGQS